MDCGLTTDGTQFDLSKQETAAIARPTGGSRDRTKSPPIVSAKREYSISVTWAEQRSAAGQIIPKAQKGESCADLRQVVAMLADIELVAFHVGPIACRPLRHAEGY